MSATYANPVILQRFKELIAEGEQLRNLAAAQNGHIDDAARFSRWTTSCLNLLDKLSISSNRFVLEFERYSRVDQSGYVNTGLPLGVLQSAHDEYGRGLAIDYQLSVSAAVFADLIDQSRYLLDKGYGRAAAVLAGAALEEAIRDRLEVLKVETTRSDTLNPLVQKLRKASQQFTQFDSARLEAVAVIRNSAAHGGEFAYDDNAVREMIAIVADAIERTLVEV